MRKPNAFYQDLSAQEETCEQWRTVKYDGRDFPNYAVSDKGRVKRIGGAKGAEKGRVTSGYISTSGYPTVGLWEDNSERRVTVHRLVAWAFIGPCPLKYDVHHRDGSRTNNRLENLEYSTRSNNILQAKVYGKNAPHWNGKYKQRNLTAEGKAILLHLVSQTQFSVHEIAVLCRMPISLVYQIKQDGLPDAIAENVGG